MLKKFQVTHNKSMEGVVDLLDSRRDHPDAGPLDLIDDRDDDPLVPFPLPPRRFLLLYLIFCPIWVTHGASLERLKFGFEIFNLLEFGFAFVLVEASGLTGCVA